MSDKWKVLPRPVAMITVAVVLLAATGLQAAEFTREFNFSGQQLTLVNMIGQVRIQPGDTGDFQVTVSVAGQDAQEDLLEFEVNDENSGSLAINFPIDQHRDYVYPALGPGSSSNIRFQQEADQEQSWLKKIFSGLSSKNIKVKGSGKGLEIWADVTVKVPAGTEIRVNNGVGEVSARQVEADLILDTRSGAVEVEDITGDVLVDTGSGAVTLSAIRGDVLVDTGSGSVQMVDCRGDKVHVDTGSGYVEAGDLVCDDFLVDTGSGGVKARGISSSKTIIDTGSGSVYLQLDSLVEGKVEIDTGSGRVELVLPEDASAHISADTGSGRIKSHLEGAVISGSDDDKLSLQMGEGQARVNLDTGSGSITISQN